MTSIYDYRTVSTPRAMPPKAFKPLPKPRITFAEMARRETQAVLASWDQVAGKFACNKEAVAARRAEWLAMLPEGQFNRIEARAAWPIDESAADNRITTLEQAGLLRRLPGKPYKWERAE